MSSKSTGASRGLDILENEWEQSSLSLHGLLANGVSVRWYFFLSGWLVTVCAAISRFIDAIESSLTYCNTKVFLVGIFGVRCRPEISISVESWVTRIYRSWMADLKVLVHLCRAYFRNFFQGLHILTSFPSSWKGKTGMRLSRDFIHAGAFLNNDHSNTRCLILISKQNDSTSSFQNSSQSYRVHIEKILTKESRMAGLNGLVSLSWFH